MAYLGLPEVKNVHFFLDNVKSDLLLEERVLGLFHEGVPLFELRLQEPSCSLLQLPCRHSSRLLISKCHFDQCLVTRRRIGRARLLCLHLSFPPREELVKFFFCANVSIAVRIDHLSLAASQTLCRRLSLRDSDCVVPAECALLQV